MSDAPDGATVLDATVLSNFAHVGRVELLGKLPRAVTVAVVREELEAGIDTHPYLEAALDHLDSEIPVVTPAATASGLESDLLESLDPGEAQALAVAEAADGTIVTDDGDARSIAATRDVTVTGSIGVLVRFVETDELAVDAADRNLKRWVDEAEFRSPARDIEQFLE